MNKNIKNVISDIVEDYEIVMDYTVELYNQNNNNYINMLNHCNGLYHALSEFNVYGLIEISTIDNNYKGVPNLCNIKIEFLF